MDPLLFPDAARTVLEEQERQIEQLEKIPEDDYYATLNVPRKATPEQIKESYRKLCMIYHPDKHVHPEAKQAAEARFHHINHAYEVLIDQAKRGLYDAYGPSCPELTVHTQVGPVLKSPDEMRAEYEERIRRENLHKLEQLIRQRGDLSVAIDASPFLFKQQGPEGPVRNPPRVQFFQLKYSTESPVTNQLAMGLAGRAFTQGQQGSGNVRAVSKMTLSRRTRAEMGVNLLAPHAANVKLNHIVDEATSTVVTTDLSFNRLSQPPQVTVDVARQLVKNRPLLGFARFHSGQYRVGGWGQGDLATQITEALGSQSRVVVNKDAVTAFTTGVQWGRENSTSLVLHTSLFQQVVQVSHRRRLGRDTTLHLDAAVDVRQGSAGGSWRLVHRVAEYTKCGVGVALGGAGPVGAAAGGTTLTVEFEHYHQRLQVPVMLLPEPNLVLAVVASAVPLAASAVTYVGYVRPRRERALAAKLADLKAKHADLLDLRRREALEAVVVLTRVIDRKWREEVAAQGLVVLQAVYGKVRDAIAAAQPGVVASLGGGGGGRGSKVQLPVQIRPDEEKGLIDVTLPVMAMVDRSMLRIEGELAKHALLGFYDPCFGEDKQLLVTYCFRGIYRQVLVEDTMGLSCPQRSHPEVEPAQVQVSEAIKEVRDRVKAMASPAPPTPSGDGRSREPK